MDIKFIGSGSAAKAILYYITNYITKPQLKMHVAYSALELSVKKLGEYNAGEDELTVQAKKTPSKMCLFSDLLPGDLCSACCILSHGL